ncbi:MAG: hypothetical protein DRG50_07680, partial [Deltaproteobacteria bacterium]
FLCKQNSSGRLLIKGEGSRGEVFLLEGKITHAFFDCCFGVKALFSMLSWKEAEYSFTQGAFTDKTTINMDTTQLLGLMKQRMHKWELIDRGKLPSLRSIFHLLPQASGVIRLTKEEWKILAKIDGRRTLIEIANELCVAPLDLSEAILRFLEAGLIGEVPSGPKTFP